MKSTSIKYLGIMLKSSLDAERTLMGTWLTSILYSLVILSAACSDGSDPGLLDSGDGDVDIDRDGDREIVIEVDDEADADQDVEAEGDPDSDTEIDSEDDSSLDIDQDIEAEGDTSKPYGSISGNVLTQAAYLDLSYTVMLFDHAVDVGNFPGNQALDVSVHIERDPQQQTISFSIDNVPPGEYYLYVETHTCQFLNTSGDPTLAIGAAANPISLDRHGNLSPDPVQVDFSGSDLSCRTIPKGTAAISGILHTPKEFLGLLTRVGATTFDAGKLGSVAQIISPADPVLADQDRISYSFSLTELPAGKFELMAMIDRNDTGLLDSFREISLYAYSPLDLSEGEQLTDIEFYSFVQDPALASISGTIHTQGAYMTSVYYQIHAFRKPVNTPGEQIQISSELGGNPNFQDLTLTYTLLNFPTGEYWIQNIVHRCPGVDNLWGELGISYPSNPVVVDTSVSKEITGVDFDVSTADLACPPPGEGVISGTVTISSPYLLSDGYNYSTMIYAEEPGILVEPLFWANCVITDFNQPEILRYEMRNLPQGSFYLAINVEVCEGPGQGVGEGYVFYLHEDNPITLGPEKWTVDDADFDFSTESFSCNWPVECSGDEGNEFGIGMACTPGGGECPEDLFCLPDLTDLFLGISEVCVLLNCTGDQDCGSGAGCLDLGLAAFCMPDRCLNETAL